MGVIRLPNVGQRNDENRNWNVDNIIQELQNRTNEVNLNSDDEHERMERLQRTRNTRRNRIQSKRNRAVKPEHTFRALGCRGKSHKKFRRYENANMLAFDNEFASDEIFGDISIEDFVESNVSAFAKLLREKEKMSMWNDFINSAEEEQEFLLQNVSDDDDDEGEDNDLMNNKARKNKSRYSSFSSTGSDEIDDENEDDKRGKHPAFSAKESFNRINNDLKYLLRKKHVPLGILESIEDDLINFFEHHPKDEYECCLDSGYQRLLLHACSQYLSLICRSFDKNGNRWSKVANSKKYFIRPTQMLTEFISSTQLNNYLS